MIEKLPGEWRIEKIITPGLDEHGKHYKLVSVKVFHWEKFHWSTGMGYHGDVSALMICNRWDEMPPELKAEIISHMKEDHEEIGYLNE